jgi:hypothetical protein
MLQNPSEGAVYSGILTKGVNMLRNKASCFYKKGGQHPPEWQLLFLAFNHALGGSAWAGISNLHEKTSVIITTNKSPRQWAETLEDEVLATALLDRLLYRCEVIKLSGNSYRMENRKTIFETDPNE